MRHRNWMLAELLGALGCLTVNAQVVVGEYARYVRHVDYEIYCDSWITILRPSFPERPYDFDCYDSFTNEPAVIQGITAIPDIGTVEIMVRENEGRLYGASDVRLLQLAEPAVSGVYGRVKYFHIAGQLGVAEPTHLGSLDGLLWAGYVVNDVYVDTLGPLASFEAFWSFQGNLWVQGAGPHYGSIYVHDLDAAYRIDINGSMLGTLYVGTC